MVNNNILDVIVNTQKEVIAESVNQLNVLVRLRANQVEQRTRTPLAVSLVIDHSGSMSGSKLEEAKRCAMNLLGRLDDQDYVSVVLYESRVKVLLELMPVIDARRLLPSYLLQVEPAGGTALHAGWLKGAETLAPYSNSDKVCRVILLSDGQANEGICDQIVIAREAYELAQAGVSTTTVGIGYDFNESLMTAMANSGQGNAWYGQRVEDLAESFDAEMSFLTHLVWKNVRVKVDGAIGRYKVGNDYLKNHLGQFTLPAIALGAEVWMGISFPMRDIIRLQEGNDSIRFIILAVDENDAEHEFTVKLPKLPVVSTTEYHAASQNEMVTLRFQELEVADIMQNVNQWVLRGRWLDVERVLLDLKVRSRENPWLEKTVRHLEMLISNRDHTRLGKQLVYASFQMKNRSTGRDEVGNSYSLKEEWEKPAFLVKKSIQGLNINSQEE